MNKFDADNKTGHNHMGGRPNSPVKFLTATSIIGDIVAAIMIMLGLLMENTFSIFFIK